ncbi:MtnX-like HAD-IB family phosphatase [Chloroflexota bacterium]
MKTLIQCDFDGTITEKDVSFLLLDAFADGNWRQLLNEYKEGKIAVGDFNTRAFAMVKTGRKTLIDYMRGKVKIRKGFGELLDYCRGKDFRFVIISNGLDFYIETILKNLGVDGIQVFAARTQFDSLGMRVAYIGPDGKSLQNNFKETYTRLYLEEGYRIAYVGNGISDGPAASLSHQIFAREGLLTYCNKKHLRHTIFNDLTDVTKGLELL